MNPHTQPLHRGRPAARIQALLAVLLLCLSFGYSAGVIREVRSPAGPGSGQPNLTTGPEGRVYLSWIERTPDGAHALRFSTLRGEEWEAARTVSTGRNWFVNWADFPSIAALPDGALAAHWLEKTGPDTFAYDVRISQSFDGGDTWTPSIVPHRDGVRTEHGFVSLFAFPGGGVGAVWLDGREMKTGSGGHGEGDMTLRAARIQKDGSITDEAVLDTRVCECCQTSAALAAAGPVVVYRDRSDREIRDISIVRYRSGAWSAPRPVHDDGWELHGCPVNGPAVSARGDRVVTAWFTGAEDAQRVRVVFSEDGGATPGKPITVDDGNPAGRVDVLLLEDGNALVSWLERLSRGAEVRVRRVRPDGNLDASIRVAASSSARSGGFPRMTPSGNTVVFAWVDGEQVRTALMDAPVRD